MEWNLQLVRKFALFISTLFLINGILNILTFTHIAYLLLGIAQTVACSIALYYLLKKSSTTRH